jgi:hypothetical protein
MKKGRLHGNCPLTQALFAKGEGASFNRWVGTGNRIRL